MYFVWQSGLSYHHEKLVGFQDDNMEWEDLDVEALEKWGMDDLAAKKMGVMEKMKVKHIAGPIMLLGVGIAGGFLILFGQLIYQRLQ